MAAVGGLICCWAPGLEIEALATAPARYFSNSARLVQAKPLFFTRLVLMRRRGGSQGSFSKPSRLSSKTPRFPGVEFCAQARGSRGLRFKSLAPVREIKRPKTEGLGLSVAAQAQCVVKVLLRSRC